MKKQFRLAAVLLACVLLLVGCGSQAYVFNGNTVKKIHLTNGVVTTTLEDPNTVQTIVSLLNSATLVPDQTSAEALPQEQYRLTLANADDKAIETVVVFSESLVQVEDKLYSGDMKSVIAILSAYFTPTSLESFSELFSVNAEDVEEVAMYDLSARSYKVITDNKDIDTVIGAIKAVTPSQEIAQDAATERFRIYLRCKGDTEYRLPLTVLASGNNLNILEYNGRFCTISSTDWKTLYTSMNYNVMP